MVKPELHKVTPIPELYLQRYEHYLPTAFNESMTLLQKVNKVIHELWRIGKLTNDMLERWNEVIEWVLNEGLEDAIGDQLDKWIEDGTIEEIINDKIFGDIKRQLLAKQDFDKMPQVNVLEYAERNELSFTQAFQNVLNLAKTRGSVHALVPHGTHALTTELVVFSNTHIECGEGVVLERHHAGYMLMNGERGKSYSGYKGHGNIKLSGGIWDGRCTHVTGGRGSNIVFAHADRIIIDNVIVKDANSHHVEINSSKEVLVTNSRFVGLLTGLDYTEAVQLDLALEGGFPAFGSYDNTPCKDVEVSNCYFGPSGTPGTGSIARAFGSHGTRIGVYHTDIRFLNNTIEEGSDYAVQTLSYEDFICDGNTFIDCEGGIIMYAPRTVNENHMFDRFGNVTTASQQCENYHLTNNIFKNCYQKACIYVYGDPTQGTIQNVKIIGNTVDGSSRDVSGCFVISHSRFCDVEDNYFNTIYTIPISFNNRNTDFTVSRNRVFRSDSSGMRIQGEATDFIIANNHFVESQRNGIEMIGGNGMERFNITDNVIKGANGGNGEWHGIYIHSGVNVYTVRGNVITMVNGFRYVNGIYITNTATNGVKGGNVVESGSNSAIAAVSTMDMGDMVIGASGLTNAPAS